jgi:hypothetical protein
LTLFVLTHRPLLSKARSGRAPTKKTPSHPHRSTARRGCAIHAPARDRHSGCAGRDGTPCIAALSPDEATVDRVQLAAELLEVIALEDTFVDFLTLPAYNRIVSLP